MIAAQDNGRPQLTSSRPEAKISPLQPVPEALEQQSSALGELHAILDILESKLDPVSIAATVKSDNANPPGPDSTGSSVLATELCSNNREIHLCLQRISHIINQLEI